MAEYIEREVLLNNLKQLAPASDKIIITLDDNTVSIKFCKNNKPEEKAEKTAEKTFIPHLESNSSDNMFGEIGKKTKYLDAVGRKLCVGDVVEHFCDGKSYGDSVVVESALSYKNNKIKQFIMGIEPICNDKDGSIDGWKIIKKRSYKDVKNGEEICGIKFITEEKPLKYYSGKLVCVESDYRHYWTVGKIYECVDGTLPTNLGSDRCLKKCKDLDDINVRNFARFIELKE